MNSRRVAGASLGGEAGVVPIDPRGARAWAQAVGSMGHTTTALNLLFPKRAPRRLSSDAPHAPAPPRRWTPLVGGRILVGRCRTRMWSGYAAATRRSTSLKRRTWTSGLPISSTSRPQTLGPGRPSIAGGRASLRRLGNSLMHSKGYASSPKSSSIWVIGSSRSCACGVGRDEAVCRLTSASRMSPPFGDPRSSTGRRTRAAKKPSKR